jgi:uncharacterized protein (TIGR00251 family)
MAGGDPWRLQIHVQPRARRTRIVGRHGGAVKVQIQAPPVGGAANAALIELLAETLGVPRHAVRLRHGRSGREKLVEVETDDAEACRRRLEACLGGRVDKPRAGG